LAWESDAPLEVVQRNRDGRQLASPLGLRIGTADEHRLT
jgi:hypothetical protein